MENSPENLSLNNPIVTILDDEDDGNLAANDISLREAIVHSQDGSKVSFDNSLKNKTILLTRGELNIDKSLTLQGFDNGQLTIDGNNKSRVFNIGDRSQKTLDVTLENLAITGGNADKQDGGGIKNTDNLTINNSTITGNTAKDGGGIYNTSNDTDDDFQEYDATTTINNSVISNNTAKNTGGGVSLNSNSFTSGDPNTLIVNGSIISGNSAKSGSGGGIYGYAVSIKIRNSDIYQNDAKFGRGGGIYNDDVTIIDSTISENKAKSGGGISSNFADIVNSTINSNQAEIGAGINIDGSDASSTICNSTISGNTSTALGGGIYLHTLFGSFNTVTNSTIADNSAPEGGGIYQLGSDQINITSSIIAGNVDNNDANGAGIISGGNNLIGNGDGAPDFVNLFNGDLVGTANKPIDPQLGELKDNGGNTFTHALLPESIAINTGSNPEKLTTDQRGKGFERVLFDAPDIGAFEADTDSIYDLPFLPPEPTSRIVTTLDDEDDGDLSVDDISLREAILESNSGDSITFDPSLSGGKITLTLGELAVDKSLNITGLGADKLTIDADNKSRVFNVDNGSDSDLDVTIGKLTISGANAGEEGGGGINNHENLTVNKSIISDNSAQGGGGVLTNNFATTTINNSTVSDNSAQGGGGVSNSDSTTTINNSTISNNNSTKYGGGGISSSSFEGGSTIVNNSTISGNTAKGQGGGIDAFDTILEVNNSTITKNTAMNSRNFPGGNGSGVSAQFSSSTFTSSIISGNGKNDDFLGNGTSGGNNLIGNADNTKAFSDGVKGDLVGTADAPAKSRLGELKDNGGLTFTHALLPDSSAINAGNNSKKLTTDQRGLERSLLQTDIGAYEVQPGSIDTANLEIIDGGLGDDILTGTTKKNILNGKAGNDTLNGGQQFDRLNGGDGDDVLIGNGGIDVLLGEEGKDLFYLENIKGSLDWIRDFELNQDRLGLADNITDDELEIAGRVNSFISYQGEQLAVVLGVSPSQLTQEQFQEI
ncbi:choice-of-anchor Q domain-containing protein [Pleurocapsa sp. FMAR1]|uniref:choice-of-anchor Q domain-containing protein n=1 Tax=Pleurocapsa sp. FMAR1 TaxID=3040204 RepID=UPI0029C6D325|nr:choice-of-anchor Q domain-containing protein [Pleurocapsa sp. FMAR1]